MPLAIVALVLTGVAVIREPARRRRRWSWRHALGGGALAAGVAFLIGRGFTSLHALLPQGGAALWSGWYGAALSPRWAIALTLGLLRRCSRVGPTRAGLATGALVVWSLIALAAGSIAAPGVSYLFVWSSLFMALALLVPRFETPATWIAAVATLLLLPGFMYGASVIMLGVVGAGAIALGVLTALIVALLAPLTSRVSGPARWLGAHWFAGAAIVFALIGALTVRNDAEHPIPTALYYVENADSSDAWLGTPRGRQDSWSREVVGAATATPCVGGAAFERTADARGEKGRACSARRAQRCFHSRHADQRCSPRRAASFRSARCDVAGDARDGSAGSHRLDRRSGHRHDALSVSHAVLGHALLGRSRQRRDRRAVHPRRRKDRLRGRVSCSGHPGNSRCHPAASAALRRSRPRTGTSASSIASGRSNDDLSS